MLDLSPCDSWDRLHPSVLCWALMSDQCNNVQFLFNMFCAIQSKLMDNWRTLAAVWFSSCEMKVDPGRSSQHHYLVFISLTFFRHAPAITSFLIKTVMCGFESCCFSSRLWNVCLQRDGDALSTNPNASSELKELRAVSSDRNVCTVF